MNVSCLHILIMDGFSIKLKSDEYPNPFIQKDESVVIGFFIIFLLMHNRNIKMAYNNSPGRKSLIDTPETI